MIDYSKVRVGDRLKITGMGAPGFANLGDEVEVLEVETANHGRVVVKNQHGKEAEFVLTCGAERLEPVKS